MVKFVCTKCRFEIEPKDKSRTEPFNRCPYCSKIGTMVVKKHILEEI